MYRESITLPKTICRKLATFFGKTAKPTIAAALRDNYDTTGQTVASAIKEPDNEVSDEQEDDSDD